MAEECLAEWRFPAIRKRHRRFRVQPVRLHHPCGNGWTIGGEDAKGISGLIGRAGIVEREFDVAGIPG